MKLSFSNFKDGKEQLIHTAPCVYVHYFIKLLFLQLSQIMVSCLFQFIINSEIMHPLDIW